MYGRRIIVLAVVMLLVLLVGCARSRQSDPAPEGAATADTAYTVDRQLPPGSRVRIVAPALSDERLEGRLEALWPDTLAVIFDAAGDERTIVPVSAVERIHVLGASRAPYGQLLGAIAGALAGGLLAYELAPSGGGTGDQLARSFSVSIGVGLGGFTGYLLGKRVDTVVFGDRWEEVPVSRVLWETRLQARSGADRDEQLINEPPFVQ
jgi:hypothetical protein